MQIKAYRDAWLPDSRGTGLDLLTVRFAAMLRDIGPGELVLIIVVVLLLFGAGAAKKLPGAAKSLGQSMRIFKAEMKQMHSDDKD